MSKKIAIAAKMNKNTTHVIAISMARRYACTNIVYKHQYGTTTHDGFDTKHSLFYKMSTMLKINFARTGLDTFCGNWTAALKSDRQTKYHKPIIPVFDYIMHRMIIVSIIIEISNIVQTNYRDRRQSYNVNVMIHSIRLLRKLMTCYLM